MADGAALPERGLATQPVPIEDAVTALGVHGEVADPVRDQVVEEVGPLRRRDDEIPEPGFHDDPGAAHLLPGNRNPEEAVP